MVSSINCWTTTGMGNLCSSRCCWTPAAIIPDHWPWLLGLIGSPPQDYCSHHHWPPTMPVGADGSWKPAASRGTILATLDSEDREDLPEISRNTCLVGNSVNGAHWASFTSIWSWELFNIKIFCGLGDYHYHPPEVSSSPAGATSGETPTASLWGGRGSENIRPVELLKHSVEHRVLLYPWSQRAHQGPDF